MKRLLFILLISAGLCFLSAQNSVFNQDSGGLTGSITSSLLNPYKLKMSHSMGFYAGSSSNGLGFYESRYTNHLAYELSPKLNLALDLNFINFGTTTQGKGFNFDANGDNQTKLVPSFSLEYRPSKSVLIHFQYNGANPYSPWYSRSTDWME